jgi:hypothetical protein
MLEICALMLFFEPSPMASMAITDATPIIIPNMVKKVRILLRRNALSATIIVFESFMRLYFFN